MFICFYTINKRFLKEFWRKSLKLYSFQINLKQCVFKNIYCKANTNIQVNEILLNKLLIIIIYN